MRRILYLIQHGVWCLAFAKDKVLKLSIGMQTASCDAWVECSCGLVWI